MPQDEGKDQKAHHGGQRLAHHVHDILHATDGLDNPAVDQTHHNEVDENDEDNGAQQRRFWQVATGLIAPRGTRNHNRRHDDYGQNRSSNKRPDKTPGFFPGKFCGKFIALRVAVAALFRFFRVNVFGSRNVLAPHAWFQNLVNDVAGNQAQHDGRCDVKEVVGYGGDFLEIKVRQSLHDRGGNTGE